MELALSEHDARLYKKLWASSRDITLAQQYAEHINKKGWYRQPWSKGAIYFQQSAYVTSMVVSYGRPFATGRNGVSFPGRLLGYTGADKALHEKMLTLRHEIYAHSDPGHWTTIPWRSEGFETVIFKKPPLLIEQVEVIQFIAMTGPLLTRINARIHEIMARY
ncbi:MAG: hypothetical protein EOO38_22990 [Cytophagaceae bacterium]|nr:MAG: hypothetical protein EOO38_22990 [Cytophagaceae bacterium]